MKQSADSPWFHIRDTDGTWLWINLKQVSEIITVGRGIGVRMSSGQLYLLRPAGKLLEKLGLGKE